MFMLVAACLAAAPAAAQSTIQQDFEAAQAALDARDLAGARAGFEALLRRLKNSNSRAGGLVKARLGSALVLDGEQEAALPLLGDALKILSADTPEDRAERAATHADRGRANEALGLFEAAAADWRTALAEAGAAPGTSVDLQLRAGLGRALIWVDPDAARREIDALLAALPQSPETREQRGLVTLLRGRVELNSDNPKEALRIFGKASELMGGTTSTMVSRADVQARGDMAIAYHLVGQALGQQRLVAMSGAGSLVSEGLGSAAATPLPPCGDGTGLTPGDVAVVEFDIGADGRVRAAVPIYATRAAGIPGTAAGVASPFVQAVRGWFWRPADLAKLNAFWRQAIRVELRCTATRPATDLVQASFLPARLEALAGLGVATGPAIPDGTDAARLPLLKADLQRRTNAHGADSIQLALPLMALAANSAADWKDRIAWRLRLFDLLEKAGAPADLLAVEKVLLLTLGGGGRTPSQRDALEAVLAGEEPVRPTARTTNLVRLELAETQDRLGARGKATALLQAIVATPTETLGRADPIRTAALLRLSNIAAARKDLPAAAEALAATGLTGEQCALVDVKPRPENKAASSSIFPEQARRWYTGGLTRVEYDIEADGRTSNVRTVLSSPPFVFGDATEQAARRFRFEPMFRPGNAPGCVGAQDNFRFQVGAG
jgi:TonB family protein